MNRYLARLDELDAEARAGNPGREISEISEIRDSARWNVPATTPTEAKSATSSAPERPEDSRRTAASGHLDTAPTPGTAQARDAYQADSKTAALDAGDIAERAAIIAEGTRQFSA